MNTAETVTAPQPETTAQPTTVDAPTDGTTPASTPRRSIVRPAMRGIWWAAASDTPALVPWRWMAYADTAAAVTHATAPNLAYAAVTAAGISAAATAWAAWQTREKRLTDRVKTSRTRHKIRTNTKAAVAAGTTWMITASTWTPAGPHGIMQLTLLGGGLAVAAPYLWRNRSRDTGVPVAEIEAPKDDQRLAKFRDHFCDHGPLTDARLHDLTYVPGGFQFHIELLLAHRGTFRDVKRLEDEIAALYDVPLDHVSVEPPESRSARRAVVTVLTATKAHQRDEEWDGTSTYDPTTGCFNPGRYADGTKSHWQLHVPYSGACSGAVVGVQGSGKTGTLHVVAAESGKAKLCTRCLGEQSCDVCDMRRICALWMGDPQSQPFSVWRGRADVTAMGPVSVVRMLSWLHAGMRYRADHFGNMEWVDHQGRRSVGKGWFDPTPDSQIHLGVIDEWPIVASDPELGPIAVSLALDILREGRKVGYGLVLGSQEADVDVLGDRGVRNLLAAFNACVHRTDSLAKRMLGIDGNPEDLPDGIHGVSYLKSLDRRSDIVHRTKHLPENLRPGQTGIDVRDIADQIAAEPIRFDEAVLRAIRPLGYTGPGQVLTDDDDWDVSALYGGTAAEETPAAEPTSAPTVVTAPAVAPPSQQAISAVQEALGHTTDADVYDLMHSTGLSALDVSRALDALITDGHATQAPTGRYAHA
jgi:hypothetical protein